MLDFSGISTLILESPVNGSDAGQLFSLFHCISRSFSLSSPFLRRNFTKLLNLPMFTQFLYPPLFPQFFSVVFLICYILATSYLPSNICHMYQKIFHHCQKKKLQCMSLDQLTQSLRRLLS